MDKLTAKQISETIERAGLHLGVRRGLPLFTLSTIAHSYINGMKKFLGFGYDARVSIGGKNWWQTLDNDPKVKKSMALYLKDHGGVLENDVLLMLQKTVSLVSGVLNTDANPNVWENITEVVNIYPDYMTCMGIVNTIWRYVGNDTKTEFLSEEKIIEYSALRNNVAEYYPKLEIKLEEYCKQVSESLKIDGDLLRYMTLTEIKNFVVEHNVSPALISELEKRRNSGYIHYFALEDSDDKVTTDKDILEEITKKYFTPVVDNANFLKGVCAEKGHFTGPVVLLKLDAAPSDYDDLTGKVLVAHFTNPAQLPLLKKVGAIITDEGGQLSHAAIVSRELRIPCIIGTKVAMQILKDGDMVEVDADNGIVKILERAK
ncbi:MAG: PEP-utilizing enzyme [Candidatus Paceibacterota bacterium]|jgi:phosphohistidine swiveling domain-containing protein